MAKKQKKSRARRANAPDPPQRYAVLRVGGDQRQFNRVFNVMKADSASPRSSKRVR